MTRTKIIELTIYALDTPLVVRLVVSRWARLPETLLGELSTRLTHFFMHVATDFSPDRPQSLLSRFQRGEITPDAFTPEFQEVYHLTLAAQRETANAFDPFCQGTYDPAGVLKGWAIHQAFEQYLQPLLDTQTVLAVALNGAGDVQMGVNTQTDFVWTVGVESPQDLDRVIRRYQLRNAAMATTCPATLAVPTIRQDQAASLQQATLITDSLVQADIWATAAVAMGETAFRHVACQRGLSGLLINRQGQTVAFSRGHFV